MTGQQGERGEKGTKGKLFSVFYCTNLFMSNDTPLIRLYAGETGAMGMRGKVGAAGASGEKGKFFFQMTEMVLSVVP